jgi:hypothetical protein
MCALHGLNNANMKKTTTKTENTQNPANELTHLELALTDFVKTFEGSTKRWEETIYPFIKSFEATTRR